VSSYDDDRLSSVDPLILPSKEVSSTTTTTTTTSAAAATTTTTTTTTTTAGVGLVFGFGRVVGNSGDHQSGL